MLKILLVFDDFHELTTVERMLKKIGFDVVGITSEFSITEQLLSLNPHVVIAQGQTPKVSTASVGRRLRESVRWDGHSVLIFYPKAKPQPAEILKMRMDVGLEYPVEPTKLVQVLAQLGGLDSHYLLDKLIKTLSQDADVDEEGVGESAHRRKDDESIYVVGGKESLTNDPIKDSTGKSKSLFPGPAATGDQPSPVKQTSRKARTDETAKDEANRSQKDSAISERETPSGDMNLRKEDEGFPLQDPLKKEAKGVPLTVNPEKKSTREENLFAVDMIKDPVLQELEGLLSKPKIPISSETVLLHDPVRAQKYAQIVGSMPPMDLLSIRRREAKSRLRDMIRDIPKDEMQNQDDLRREFVKALFKPKT